MGSESGEKPQILAQGFTELRAGLFSIPLNWPWIAYGKALCARDRILQHIEGAIIARQQHPANDALGLLVQPEDEQGDRLDIDELKTQALLMLFAGHETTTSMLTSLVLALAQNPEVCDRARTEQEQLSSSGDLTLHPLREMPYLEQVLKEVERLYPPVGSSFRGVVNPFDFNGYHVSAG